MESIDLKGRKGLVVGIANEHSLAWAAAKHFRNAGAELAITYLNDRAKPHVAPLAHEADSELFLQCDVATPGELEAVFDKIRTKWGPVIINDRKPKPTRDDRKTAHDRSIHVTKGARKPTQRETG